jgi:hypothetical protein
MIGNAIVATKGEVILGRTKPPRFDSSDLFFCLLVASLPFVLLAVNDNWIFSQLNTTDPWIYAGFHLHLREFLRTFGYTYYASRLPWTVAGWLLHSSFDDAHALYILHFGVFYLAVFSFYVAIRTIFANAVAAGAAALLFGTHSYFLQAVGWDYVDGPSLACSLVGIAALASAAIQRRWRLAAFVWGVAMCAMVSLYILLVLLVPVQIGMFLLLNRLRGRRSILAVGAWFTTGAIAAMLALGLINSQLGGPLFYILGQIRILSAVAANRYTENLPLAQWVGKAPWLLLPAITFAFSCVYIWLRAASVSKKIRLDDAGADPEVSLFLCCLVYIMASLIYLGLEADHFNVLHFMEYAVALLPFAYLTIGGALAVMIKPSGQVQQLVFFALIALIALVPWVLATLGYAFPRWDLFEGLTFEVLWIMVGSLLLLFALQRSYWGAALAILLLSVINLGAPSHMLSYPPNPAVKPETLAVFDASRAVGRYNPDAHARFWFNAKAPEGHVLRSVVASYLWDYSLVNEEFPKLITANGEQGSIAPGDRIILLTSTAEDPVALANAAVANQNLSFQRVAKTEIRRPGVAFAIFVTDVKIDSSKYKEIALSQISSVELPLKIITPTGPWWYATQFPLQIRDLKGPLWIRIHADVHGGPIGIGILNHDGSAFVTRAMVTADDTMVYLRVPEPRESGNLVIQSWAQGVPAEVRVDAITVLKPWSTVEDPVGTPAASSSGAPAPGGR